MKAVSIAFFAGIIACALVQPVSAGEFPKGIDRVHSFGSGTDGRSPYASLIDVKGTLYGTTSNGGANCSKKDGCGVVFALDPKTGTETVVYSFCSQEQVCKDGAYPRVSLIEMKGILYGTTAGGGNTACSGGCGTIFALDPNTGVETVLYSFGSGSDGAIPFSGLSNVNGMLYGTTTEGGGTGCHGYGCGTAFALDPSTGAETVLHSFGSGADGQNPEGNLIEVGGVLYGTTNGGGTQGAGTMFTLDPETGAETVIYSFCSQPSCADGGYPIAGLIIVKGTLYGTTPAGGNHSGYCDDLGCGTVFVLDPTTGTESVVYSFCGQPNCADGDDPEASLIDVEGTLYGTTLYAGGRHRKGGTVFALDPNSGAEAVLYTFCGGTDCKDGSFPLAALSDVKGTLYGTTSDGGAYSFGTVFALKP